jgi:hypothetical protein
MSVAQGAAEHGNACKRLQKELMTLMMSAGSDDGISAFPDADNILTWTATIAGSKDTPFEGSLMCFTITYASGLCVFALVLSFFYRLAISSGTLAYSRERTQ